MCLVWKIVGFDKHSNPGPKHLGSFECKNCATFLALFNNRIHAVSFVDWANADNIYQIDTFFIQTRVINGKIFPEPRVRSTSGEGKILPLITRVCMKNVILSYLCV